MAMTDKDTMRDVELDSFFAAARSAPEPASKALLARVMADAQAVQASAATTASAQARTTPKRGWGAGFWAALGGWPAMGGLAFATVAGLWIGFSPILGGSVAVQSAMGLDAVSNDGYLVDYATGYEYAFEGGEAG
ncbi:hypothetical protein U5922_009960 [Aquicoccus sp. G2-2]|uniref:hypothetical protein n=1 Tax=Aquicoccus sp. G2-2 TaxID=3092120 RepID=UPI002ADFC4ED|nr:hypothetical protein [Aquicoccus sp. G2-2]MEA1113784.1 hypothetical protein [Aquicoccus sp. G2-2]